jgi:hypothetical protein
LSALIDDNPAHDSGEVAQFLADPPRHFGRSYTAMHSIERATMNQLQAEGLALRFARHVRAIPMLSELADRTGTDALDRVEDALPLLFDHRVYKSYPLSYLEYQQFDLLTGWLSKLTSAPLADADTTECDSIESWLSLLVEATPLDITYSSGTSGTMSFFPWTKHELRLRAQIDRVSELQTFGHEPAAAQLDGAFHYVGSPSRKKYNYTADAMTLGASGHLHLRGTRRPSADLMWLASRLRAVRRRGENLDDVAVPAALLARRGELEQLQANSEASDQAWLDDVASLHDDQVVWVSYPYDFYTIAGAHTARGQRRIFAPGSVVALLGGAKGYELPEDGLRIARQFTTARITQGYGMTELLGLNFLCEAGRYHLQPWTIPFVLDPHSGEPLPREGRRRGRFGFVDLAAESHWGGLLTGDDVEVEFDARCRCGATTQHIGPDIERYADSRGSDDKIRGAAAPQAYAEAMQFLIGR